jgi:hypothetical protein
MLKDSEHIGDSGIGDVFWMPDDPDTVCAYDFLV